MFVRYLLLPSALLRLALAASNSSVPGSTSTVEITSFLTLTVPAQTGSANASRNGTGLDYASSCNQAKLDWVENRGRLLPPTAPSLQAHIQSGTAAYCLLKQHSVNDNR